MSNAIDQYMKELEDSKVDLKRAIIAKGVTPTGGLSSYADAIKRIPSGGGSKLSSLNETLTENGAYSFRATDDGVDGYSRVDINVDIEIPEIPTFETQSKSVEIKKNGTQTITPDSGYDGLSSVKVKVNVASTAGKMVIPNGFRFTGGDVAQVDFSQYDWSMVYDTAEFFRSCSHSTGDWSNFIENFNGELLNGSYLFAETNFSEIPLLDYSKILDTTYMFYNQKNITSVPDLNIPNVLGTQYMFSGASNIETIAELPFDYVDSQGLFQSCAKLKNIPLKGGCKLYGLMKSTFDTCKSLTNKELYKIVDYDFNNVSAVERAFATLPNLLSFPPIDDINIRVWNNNGYSSGSPFAACSNLKYIEEIDVSYWDGTQGKSLSYMFYAYDSGKSFKHVRFKGDPSHVPNSTIWSGTWYGTPIMYYDKRYDYSTMISRMPTTWVAIPFPYGDEVTAQFRVFTNGDWLQGDSVKVGTETLRDAIYKGSGLYEITVPQLETMRDLVVRVNDIPMGCADPFEVRNIIDDDGTHAQTIVIEGDELLSCVTSMGDWIYEEGVGLYRPSASTSSASNYLNIKLPYELSYFYGDTNSKMSVEVHNILGSGSTLYLYDIGNTTINTTSVPADSSKSLSGAPKSEFKINGNKLVIDSITIKGYLPPQ